ncbi:MAG: MFS transporter [Patescibacteria group bacterium]|nr:MFS transporter [Patescibacteria group bacterium]
MPSGVKILAWARAVRWIGWGFGEALIPVFILMFSNTFAEMGLLASTVDIASLVSLPIIGMWADRVPARKLILWSLALYPLVGVSYYLAGVWGMAIFIVAARAANGVTWELENVGIETYYRRAVDHERVATSFGYVETWSHIAWITAALGGIVLLRFVSIPFLLLLIAPFAAIAYFMVLKAPKDPVEGEGRGRTPSLLGSYGKALGELRTWGGHLWLLGGMVMFSSVVSSLMYLFVPIDAYINGADLPMVVLVTVFGSLPALFAYQLGKIADAGDKYKVISFSLLASAAVAVGLIIFPSYWFKLIAMFLMGIVLELLYVAQGSLVTTLGPEERYGERGSAFESITVLGDLSAPLLIGVAFDAVGFGTTLLSIALIAVIFGLVYRRLAAPSSRQGR